MLDLHTLNRALAMEPTVEREVVLPRVLVQVSTLKWEGVEEVPPYSGYALSQRLSEDHSPLRIGNLTPPQVLPRVRSVGLLPPGRPVRMLPVEKPLRVIYCVFDEAHFEHTTGIPRQRWEEHVNALVSIKNKRLEVLMQEICAELEQPDFGSELLVEAVSTMILVELSRYARQLDRKSAGRRESLSLAPWQLRRIQERIQASLDVGYPNLRGLSELCGVSEGHLMRSFKAATGWQIQKYIAEERLKAAKALLTSENDSCREISRRLGFKSSAYFSTFFHRMTGKTPTEFRKQAKAGEHRGP